MSLLRTGSVAIFWTFLSVVSATAEPKPVNLAPTVHMKASLTVLGADGKSTVYSPADLEKLPTYQIVTATPWRDEPAVFTGILLIDLLELHGLLSAQSIVVTAENDFSTTFSRRTLAAANILVATRVNGVPHSRRARGPIQFVVEEEVYQSSGFVTEAHLVWMASRIEAAQ